MEFHLFIIWEQARNAHDRIVDDLANNFQIAGAYTIVWSKSRFSVNLTRLYGTHLPNNSRKEEHCGNGPFQLYVVIDKNPRYEERVTSNGKSIVNKNTFDAKMRYREWTGGGHKIHATNSIEEFNHDIVLLLGRDASDNFLNGNLGNWDGSAINLHHDLAGARGWQSLPEFLSTLELAVNYVVLRNYECMPGQYGQAAHGDIDVLSKNFDDFFYVSGGSRVFKQKYRVQVRIPIGGEQVQFDIRSVGDGYYDRQWQADILSRRILQKGGFYTPSLEDYFYSLLYHAAVHKFFISKDYSKKLAVLAQQLEIDLAPKDFQDRLKVKLLLTNFLRKREYEFSDPKDLSVLYNHRYCGIQRHSIRRLFYTLFVRKRLALQDRLKARSTSWA